MEITPELRQTTLLTEEICSDLDSFWSKMTPRNLVEETLVIAISLMITGGKLMSTERGDLEKKMKFVLAWFMESLFAINQRET